MPRTTINTWIPDFLEKSPIFDCIHEVSLPFTALSRWPSLEQFSAEFKKRNILSGNNILIEPVEQSSKPITPDDYYESRIYLKGELQTRIENWHDFFNAMCWLQFPKTKAALNALHYEHSAAREVGTNRSPVENAITLFDECGAIVISEDEYLLDLIRNHEWKALFLDNSEAFGKTIQCYVFGHAIYEKSLSPYIGMTAHSILLKQCHGFCQKDYSEQLDAIDKMITVLWRDKKILTTKDLQPFPLLGVPGWWNNEQDERFYLDGEYFRKKSRVSDNSLPD